MEYVGEGSPYHEAFRQRIPVSELWWRLLEPYEYKECPDHVKLNGDKSKAGEGDASDQFFGHYAKTQFYHDHRPVYKNEGSPMYLFLSKADSNNWLVGPDFRGKARGVQSSSAGAASCPEEAKGWTQLLQSGWSDPNEPADSNASHPINATAEYCGREGPQLLWRPIARECGDSHHEEWVTSTLSECAIHDDRRKSPESAMADQYGSFWEDGAVRAKTDFKWSVQAETDLEASEDVRDAKGRARESMKTEMVHVAEAQLRSFHICRYHPDQYEGVPYTSNLAGGGFAPDDKMPRCNEMQQMRGRCEGQAEFHFDYYRTCHGRMDEHSSSWFCMTGIDRPGFMTPGLLRREGDAARLPAPSVALPALAAALIFAVAAVLFKGSKQRRGAASANLV